MTFQTLAVDTLFSLLLAVWAMVVFWVGVTALLRLVFFQSRQRSTPAAALSPDRILLIRPCSGNEPFLEACLVSVVRAQRSVPVDVMFGVNSEGDAAIPVIQQACLRLAKAGLTARLQVAPVIGPNRKVTILENCLIEAGDAYDTVLWADSNVDLTGFDLDQIVRQLASSPTFGIVWVPPVEKPLPHLLGNRTSVSVLNGSWHAFTVLRAIDFRGMVGKCVAVNARALDATGGLSPLVDYLGEDMQLARRFHQAGYQVVSSPQVITSITATRTWKETFRRQVRWMMVIKAQRPILMASFPLLFCSTPLIILFSVLAALGPGSWWPVLLFACGLSLLTRMVIGTTARVAAGYPFRWWNMFADIPLADGTLLLAFFTTVFSRAVAWRGVQLRLRKGGRIVDSAFNEESDNG